ncbi:hypothetical protein GCM10009847_12250 [Leucobacter tardus]|uniref:DUF7882 domain-containing protein n=1 Tax=Leucobacter tardus TaxID=501483 RepID=A0A939QDZ9_9MICO|nr:hypothetical protein [Leucobacter tardus]MBO2989418.1 hypothetical protein [Leucobacter tardus]
MGHLIYGDHDHDFEDRLLAHLKTAIGQKLRRQEPFFLNWNKSLKEGDGRMAIWVSPYVPLTVRYSGSRQPEINPVWVRVLEDTASQPYGMRVMSEEQAERYAHEHY